MQAQRGASIVLARENGLTEWFMIKNNWRIWKYLTAGTLTLPSGSWHIEEVGS